MTSPPAPAATLSALLALMLASPAEAQQPPAGQGVDVVHYEVRLRPYLLGRAVSGQTEITLRGVEEGAREVVFSGNALAVDSASLDGRPVARSCGTRRGCSTCRGRWRGGGRRC
jgi:hypothetical protein